MVISCIPPAHVSFFFSAMNSKQWSLQLTRKKPGFTIVCSGSESLAAVLQASNESIPAELEFSCDGVLFFSAVYLGDFECVKLDQKTNSKLDIRLKQVCKSTKVNIFGSSIGNVSIIPTEPETRNVHFNDRLDCNFGDGLTFHRVKSGIEGTKLRATVAAARFEIDGEVKTVRFNCNQFNEGFVSAIRRMQIDEERIVTVPACWNGKEGNDIYRVRFLGI